MQLLTHFLPSAVTDQLIVAWCDINQEHPPEILSRAEADEWNTFKNPGRRQEYLATRWLIRQMAEHFAISPTEFILEKDKFGKPFSVFQGTEYHVSIAHTNEQVLGAISADMELGVDMEPVKRRVPSRLRQRILNPKEKSLLAGEPTIRIWTLKEALVKLQGTGMRTNLNDCIITSREDGLYLATFNNDNRAKICSFKHADNWFAIAWNS